MNVKLKIFEWVRWHLKRKKLDQIVKYRSTSKHHIEIVSLVFSSCLQSLVSSYGHRTDTVFNLFVLMTLLLSYTLWWSSACGWASSRATLPLLILSLACSLSSSSCSFHFVIVELYCHWSCARDFLVSFNRPNSWMNGWWKKEMKWKERKDCYTEPTKKSTTAFLFRHRRLLLSLLTQHYHHITMP